MEEQNYKFEGWLVHTPDSDGVGPPEFWKEVL